MGRLGKIAAMLIAAGTLFAVPSVANAAESADASKTIRAPRVAATLSARAASEDDSDATAKYNAVKITGVTVEDVGAHSAGLSLSYTVDPAYKDQIASVCPVINVYEFSQFKFNGPEDGKFQGASGGFPWDFDCKNGIQDEDLTQADYERIFGEHVMPAEFNDGFSIDATGRYWQRYYRDAWDTKERPTSGTFDVALVGLQPNHSYGHRNLPSWGGARTDAWDAILNWAGNNLDKLGQTTKVDISSVAAGVHVEFTDGTSNTLDSSQVLSAAGENAVYVPDFTTKSEPKIPSEQDVLGSAKNDMSTQGGNAKQDSTYRLYIKNLSDVCKAQIDAGNANPCVWYGYIYSTPTALTDPSGAPYLTVQKDGKATDSAKQYYVDVYIPKTVADGEHKIALADENGAIQGWTPVVVGDADPSQKAAEALYNEWGYPIVDESVQGNRGKASNGTLFTEDSWNAYKTKFASVSGKISDVYKNALNNTDKTAAVALLAKLENVADLENELRGAQESLKFAKPQTVYRLYDQHETHKHLYTTDEAEYERQVAKDWRDETSVAGSSFSVTPYAAKDEDGNVPAETQTAVDAGFIKPTYRVYQKYDQNGKFVNRHFYTSVESEYKGLVKQGWRDEGVAWYSRVIGGTPVYRTYSKERLEHLYTSSKTEADNSVAHYGYRWDKGYEVAFNSAN